MIKLKDLLREDVDQNNNGYPDSSEGNIPATKNEWWALVKQDLTKWNARQHPEDRLSIQDWIGEVGPKIHGWFVTRDRFGEWEVNPPYADDEFDEDEDEFDF